MARLFFDHHLLVPWLFHLHGLIGGLLGNFDRFDLPDVELLCSGGTSLYGERLGSIDTFVNVDAQPTENGEVAPYRVDVVILGRPKSCDANLPGWLTVNALEEARVDEDDRVRPSLHVENSLIGRDRAKLLPEIGCKTCRS